MKYTVEAIEKRNFIIKITKQILKRLLYIVLILCIYNGFLITKSAFGTGGAKDAFGYKAYIITTESMRPTIKSGDVAIVEVCEENKLKIGDIITIKTEEGTNTHRIIEIKTDIETNQKQYITKGDNNNIEDPDIVNYDQIEGKKVIIIPFLGTLLLSLKNKAYIVLLGILVAFVTFYVVNRQKKKKVRRERKKYEDKKIKDISQDN